MHSKVLSPRAWAVVRRLVSAGHLEGWILAGGTGLALEFGHRLSEDLDFFRAGAFEPQSLCERLDRLRRRVPVAVARFLITRGVDAAAVAQQAQRLGRDRCLPP